MKLSNLFSKPKEEPPAKKSKPVRVSVHHNGLTYVHWCRYISNQPDGVLTLYDRPAGGEIVAKYASGSWSSFSTGKRAVSRGYNK